MPFVLFDDILGVSQPGGVQREISVITKKNLVNGLADLGQWELRRALGGEFS